MNSKSLEFVLWLRFSTLKFSTRQLGNTSEGRYSYRVNIMILIGQGELVYCWLIGSLLHIHLSFPGAKFSFLIQKDLNHFKSTSKWVMSIFETLYLNLSIISAFPNSI